MSDISPLFAIEAEELLEIGNFDEAIELCQKGLEVYPEYESARLTLSKAYKLKGDIDAAEETANEVISKNPQYSKAKEMIFSDNNKISKENEIEELPDEVAEVEEFDAISGFAEALSETEKIPEFEESSESEELTGKIDEVVDLSDFGESSESEEIPDENEEDVDETDTYTEDFVAELEENEEYVSEFEETNSEVEEIPEVEDSSESEDLIEEIEEEISELESAIDEIEELAETEELTADDDETDAFTEDFVAEYDEMLNQAIEDSFLEDEIKKKAEELIENEEKISKNRIDFTKINSERLDLIPGLEFYTRIEFDAESNKDSSEYKLRDLLNRTFTSTIKVKEEKPEVDALDPALVTETFANILKLQGAFTQAIEAYRILINKNPNKAELYLEKIDDLESKLKHEL